MFCFRSSFTFFNHQPAVRHNILTSSGHVHPVAIYDYVFLVESLQYHVIKVCRQSDTVCLQKFNTREPPFKCSIRQIWLLPHPTIHSLDSVNLPSINCFCPELLPPPVFPDVEDTSIQADAEVMDVSVQADFGRTISQDTWVVITTENSSVNQLDTTFQEPRREAEFYYDMYTNSDKALTAARASFDKLTTEVQQLRTSSQDLNATHNSLMKNFPDKPEEISSFRTQLSQAGNSYIKALSKKCCRQIFFPCPLTCLPLPLQMIPSIIISAVILQRTRPQSHNMQTPSYAVCTQTRPVSW